MQTPWFGDAEAADWDEPAGELRLCEGCIRQDCPDACPRMPA